MFIIIQKKNPQKRLFDETSTILNALNNAVVL